MTLRSAAVVTPAFVLATTLAAAQPATVTLQSPAFKDGAAIPVAYSGYGDFTSPPLTWSGLPRGTRELALIMDDPDVPMEQFSVHWVVYNIPAAATGLPETGKPPKPGDRPAPIKGAAQGPNAMKHLGYLPPRPFAGSGVHHYTFTLYALDADLPLADGLTKDQLLAAMKGHILGVGKLVGLFERGDP